MMKMKRQRKDRDRDRLSDLPDYVLLHIMKFISIKDAVQTCVLSKRWKDLWKDLTVLKFDNQVIKDSIFNKFVSSVLSSRHRSTSLHSLDFISRSLYSFFVPNLLNRVMSYAVLHNIQQLTIDVHLESNPFVFNPKLFSCRSLTLLKVSFGNYRQRIEIPKYLQLPALKSLHLGYVIFTASDNECADPFSTCNMLNTLVICCFHLHHDVKVLRISNSNLSSLTIVHHFLRPQPCKIAISTPNVNSLTVVGTPMLQLSFACNLSFLEEVCIRFQPGCERVLTMDAGLDFTTDLVILNWLQVLANVKIMTLSSYTLSILLNDLSKSGSTRIQPPCFVRLEALKVKMLPSANPLDEEVNGIVEYLLQNSPLAKVDIID